MAKKKSKKRQITVRAFSGLIHDMKAECFEVEDGDVVLYNGSRQIARFAHGYWSAVGYGG